MRVVFVNRYGPPDHSATSQMLADLAASLVAKGMAVTIVASRQRYDDPGARLTSSETWQGVEIRRIWTSRFGRAQLLGRALDYLTFYLRLPATLWGLLKRGDVAIAKTDPPLVGLVVALVARLRGCVFVNWLQDVFPEVAVKLGEPKLPRSAVWFLQRLRNASLRAAAMNVCVGTRMAAYLAAQGIPAERLLVIPNWAHEDAIQPMPVRDSALRATLGLGEKFVVGYAGNLGRAHDCDTIYSAAARLSGDSRIAFLVVGGGKGYEVLRHRCAETGLKNILFLPYQPLAELADAMAAANLHLISLLPELEGLIVPSKFYGIAAAARPMVLIGDPDGELARVIAQGECGFTVAPGQFAQLAERILELANSPGASPEMGRRARQLLEKDYSRDAAHRRWHDLLAVLGRGASIALRAE